MNLILEYEQDFNAWVNQHIALLQHGRLAEIDVGHLIEELESMGKRDRRELVSHLVILIAHLLKWEYQPDHRSNSWRNSIREQRYQITSQLQESPSLKSRLPEALSKAYPDAVELASDETELPFSTFPKDCPYTITQLLDKWFLP
jgi:hypothetical protein